MFLYKRSLNSKLYKWGTNLLSLGPTNIGRTRHLLIFRVLITLFLSQFLLINFYYNLFFFKKYILIIRLFYIHIKNLYVFLIFYTLLIFNNIIPTDKKTKNLNQIEKNIRCTSWRVPSCIQNLSYICGTKSYLIIQYFFVLTIRINSNNNNFLRINIFYS